MRKDAMWGVLAVVAVMGMAACGGERSAQSDTLAVAPAKTVTVSINIQCATSDSTFIKVTPWEAKLKKNNKDTLVFVVDPASTTDSVIVELKSGTAGWPLTDRPPYRVQKNAGTKKELGKNQPTAATTYPYNIRAYCTQGGTVRRFLIDPDIFVD